MAHKGLKEYKGLRAQMVRMGLPARKGLKGKQAPQDRMVLTAHKARREYKGLLAQREMPLSILISPAPNLLR
jgi:hypothetical protein